MSLDSVRYHRLVPDERPSSNTSKLPQLRHVLGVLCNSCYAAVAHLVVLGGLDLIRRTVLPVGQMIQVDFDTALETILGDMTITTISPQRYNTQRQICKQGQTCFRSSKLVTHRL